MATELITTVVPLDGTWSDNFIKGVKGEFSTTITTQVRPRIYYFEILDCDKKVSGSFRTGNPRIFTDIHMTASDKQFEYSFEYINLLELYFGLFIMLGSLFGLLVKSFIKFYREEEKLMSPHPIMLFSLGAQVLAIFC